MSVMTRDEYDRYCEERLAIAGHLPTDIERLMERKYPKNTEGAVEELRFRGVDATHRRVESWAARDDVNLRIIGKMRAWYRSDIDAFAEALERRDKLLPPALYRKERGMSWTEWRELEKHLEASRVATICEVLGVNEDELYAALTHGLGGGVWHPLHGMWTEEQLDMAAAWFHKYRDSDAFRECLAEVVTSRRKSREGLQAWRAWRSRSRQ